MRSDWKKMRSVQKKMRSVQKKMRCVWKKWEVFEIILKVLKEKWEL